LEELCARAGSKVELDLSSWGSDGGAAGEASDSEDEVDGVVAAAAARGRSLGGADLQAVSQAQAAATWVGSTSASSPATAALCALGAVLLA
jgi:hypothetical protein